MLDRSGPVDGSDEASRGASRRSTRITLGVSWMDQSTGDGQRLLLLQILSPRREMRRQIARQSRIRDVLDRGDRTAPGDTHDLPRQIDPRVPTALPEIGEARGNVGG